LTAPLIYPPIVGTYRDLVLRDNPLLFYEFSDNRFTDGIIYDLSPNGNNGFNPNQAYTPILATGQIGNQDCALFPFTYSNNASIQTNVPMAYAEFSAEVTISSTQYEWDYRNDRLMATGQNGQGASSSGFELFMRAAPLPDGATPTQAQVNFTIGTAASEWADNTAYAVGDRVFPTNANAVYTCTTAGTSGTSQPSGEGTAITDGTVVWEYTCPDFINLSAPTNSQFNLIPGEVYHVCATVSLSGNVTIAALYINGIVAATENITNFGAPSSPYNLGIAYNPAYSGNFFCGWMGAAAVYSYGLTPYQVWEHSTAFFSGLRSA